MVLKLIVGIMETEGGFLIGMREEGGGNIGWNVDRMRRESFFSVQFCDIESKKYYVIFPKGRGLLGGYNILADKLRDLGKVCCQ